MGLTLFNYDFASVQYICMGEPQRQLLHIEMTFSKNSV